MDPTPKRYFFDNNDFDEEVIRAKAAAVEEAKRRPSFSQDEMEASRQTGFSQGRQEGVRETMASLDAQMAELMQQVKTALGAFESQEQARTNMFVEQASLMAAHILSKSLPALQNYMALPELQAFLEDTLNPQVKKGQMTIYVPARYADALNSKIAELAANNPQGHLWSVKASDALSGYECNIEWDGGGASWDARKVSELALEALAAQIPDYLRADITVDATIDAGEQNPHTDIDTRGDETS